MIEWKEKVGNMHPAGKISLSEKYKPPKTMMQHPPWDPNGASRPVSAPVSSAPANDPAKDNEIK